MILPARFRSSFDTSLFITPHYERCLALWPQEEFERKFAEMSNTQEQSTEGRNLARIWSNTSAQEKIDAQGRIFIPPKLREFAGLQLESPVLVTGSFDRIELWNPESWAARIAPFESFLENPDLFGGPGVTSAVVANPES